MHLSCANELRRIAILALLLGAWPPLVRCQQTSPETPGKAQEQTAAQSGKVSVETGETVVAVRIVTKDGRVLSESPAGVTVTPGKPLDRAQVAASIRALYRTGDYAEIRAVSTRVPGGIRLDFVVTEQLFFNQVLIHGLTAPPTEASAAAAMQLPLGEPFQQSLVNEGVERLRGAMQEDGLYASEISVNTVPHPEFREMDVIVNVKSGPRARVKQIQVQNGTEYGDAEILRLFKVKPGKPITAARIRSGTERIRKFLVKKSRLNARATVHRGEYDPKTNSVSLQLEVTEGPLVRLVATGAKISGGEMKKLVPVYQEGTVDTDLLEEGKRNIRERLERKGYFDAEVNYITSTREVQLRGSRKATEELITYQIERGDKHHLLGIEITGNHYFNTPLLRSRLQISAKTFGTRGRFSRRLMEADRQSMLNLYLANGFLGAKVDAQALDNVGGKEGDLLIRFVIQEGKQTRVASLDIEGAHAFTKAILLNVIASTPGEPYSDFNVARDRDNILALYYNEGFPDARFTANAERSSAPATESNSGARTHDGGAKNANGSDALASAPDFVRLVYNIEEGPQIRVRQVLLSGYVHTHAGVIRREVRVKASGPLRQGEVVESQRRLYNLGVFNRVTIEPQNPNGSDPDKNIVVLVEEAKRYTIAYGGGFEVQRLASTNNPAGSQIQAAPRGIFEVSKLNLTGRGDSLSLKLRGSTIENRAILGYTEPNAFNNSHFTLQASAYTEKTQDINTFTEERYQGALQVNEVATRHTSFLYHYAFRKVLVTNINSTLSPAEIPLFSAPTLVSQAGITWVRDARDNPADPKQGNFNSFDFSVADTGIGSSASFLRFFYQNSTYHPIGSKYSFARGIRIGILEPYRNTASLTFTAPPPGACTATTLSTMLNVSVIPLPERFFAGGGTSLRGFALNQAGPRDPCTGFPVGGQTLLITNQEFRFPMHLPYLGSSLGGAIFYDAGNVFSRLGRVTLRWSSPKPVFDPANPKQCLYNCTNELNYLAQTVGFGFRYATPVGPIRIDLGYQLNQPQFVAPICLPGVPARQCLQGIDGFQATRLPHFQVFFNLGTSF